MRALRSVLAAALMLSTFPSPQAAAATIDPRADKVLRRMNKDLTSLQSFRVVGDSSLDVVLKSGEKRDFTATSYLAVKRPNKLRSDRMGDTEEMTAYYDGEKLTLMGRRANAYATTSAPGTIDEAVDFARNRLQLDVPAADLLSSDPYAALTENALSGKYLGEAVVDGALCDHLAFRGEDVDYQLWVEKDSALALPRKYTITSRKEPGAPLFVVTLHDWQPKANLSDSLFEFAPPPGATRIDFLGVERHPGFGSRLGEGE